MTSTSLLSTAVNLLASPGEAFAVIRERPRPIFPLVLILAGLITVTMLYITRVDLAWYIELQLRASGAAAEMSEQQILEAADAVSGSPAFIGAVGSVTSSLFIVITYLIYSLYLWGAASLAKHGIRFGQAFALICWCSLPGVLGYLASIVNLLVSDVSLLPQHKVNPLSFGSIFGLDAENAAAAGGAGQIMLGLDITFVWTALLLVIGYQAWSKKSLPVAASITLAPFVVLIAIGTWSSIS